MRQYKRPKLVQFDSKKFGPRGIYVIIFIILLVVACQVSVVLYAAYFFLATALVLILYTYQRKAISASFGWRADIANKKSVKIITIILGLSFGCTTGFSYKWEIIKTFPTDFLQMTSVKQYEALENKLNTELTNEDTPNIIETAKELIAQNPSNSNSRRALFQYQFIASLNSNYNQVETVYDLISSSLVMTSNATDWATLGTANYQMAINKNTKLAQAKLGYAKAALYDWDNADTIVPSPDAAGYENILKDIINKYSDTPDSSKGAVKK